MNGNGVRRINSEHVLKNNKNNFGFDDSSRAFTLNALLPDWVLGLFWKCSTRKGHLCLLSAIQVNLWAQNFAAGLQELANMT